MLHAGRPGAMLVVLALLLGHADRGHAQTASVRQVKAAFLYNFARFTEWPGDAFASASHPLVIGVAGDEVLRLAIDNLVRGKLVGGRELTTRLVRNAHDTAGVQLLYIGGTASARAEDFIDALGGGPVLTVGEVDRFSDKGGMINFLIADNRVRFEISVSAAERARLKVSSRVLTLAHTLHGTGKR